MSRRVVLVTHPGRPDAAGIAEEFAGLLRAEGVTPVVPSDQAALFGGRLRAADGPELLAGAELVVVLGGDGTILGGAERARESGVPLLGMNLGHVGFLAEAEQNELADVARAVVGREYRVEERLALDVDLFSRSGGAKHSWALNEATIEKAADTRMVDLLVRIDGEPLSRWGADGLVLSTPTGSTAYAWSAGGPVVWPDVEALLVVPLSAHALFARPLVVSPTCEVSAEMLSDRPQRAVVWCDGRRQLELAEGDTVVVRRSDRPVPLARLHSPAFVERLVGKFDLPVEGWRRPPGPPAGLPELRP